MARYLLVAHQTAERRELLDAALELAAGDPQAEFTLLVPTTPVGSLLTWEEGESRDVARSRAESASALLQRHALNLVEARVGDADPVLAVGDAFLEGHRYEAIVISTLPVGVSRWVKMDVVSRLRRAHPNIPVIHVAAGETESSPGPGTDEDDARARK